MLEEVSPLEHEAHKGIEVVGGGEAGLDFHGWMLAEGVGIGAVGQGWLPRILRVPQDGGVAIQPQLNHRQRELRALLPFGL